MKFWAWFFQRITGILLVLLLITHIYIAYFTAPGAAVTYDLVRGRMQSMLLYVNLLLLYTALFHGLYGLKVVITDLLPEWKTSYVTLLLTLGGLGLSIYGTRSLLSLVT